MTARLADLANVLVALVASLTIASCGNGGGGASVAPGTLDCRSGGAAYPAGGCGTSQGQTIANYHFEGHNGGIGTPRVTVHVADLYDPDGTKGLRFLVLSATSLWCPYCVEESKALPSMKATYGAQGAVFMTVLLEDLRGSPASQNDVDSFITTYDTTTIVVNDGGDELASVFDHKQVPLHLIIDLRTMRIVKRYLGGGSATVRSSLELALAGRSP